MPPVAPRVGAWIETTVLRIADRINKSRPAWARGLKLLHIRRVFSCVQSRAPRGRVD